MNSVDSYILILLNQMIESSNTFKIEKTSNDTIMITTDESSYLICNSELTLKDITYASINNKARQIGK